MERANERVIVAGGPALLRDGSVPRAELVAVTGLGEPGTLARLIGVGAIVGAHSIARFGTVGRLFVELVEHVHHELGPTEQSIAADTIRASLFGKHGELAVNLATRAAPVDVGPLATLIWLVDPEELGSVGGEDAADSTE